MCYSFASSCFCRRLQVDNRPFSSAERYLQNGTALVPDGSVYATSALRAPEARYYRFRFRLRIRGSRAETLPGDWGVRILINERLAGSAKFTLQLVGDPKVWVPALGVVEVTRMVTANGARGNEPVGEASEFKVGETVYSCVRFEFSSSGEERSVHYKWQWTAPSGERLERARRGVIRGDWSSVRWCTPLPSFQGRVQNPVGMWQGEFLIDDVVVARFQFNMVP